MAQTSDLRIHLDLEQARWFHLAMVFPSPLCCRPGPLVAARRWPAEELRFSLPGWRCPVSKNSICQNDRAASLLPAGSASGRLREASLKKLAEPVLQQHSRLSPE